MVDNKEIIKAEIERGLEEETIVPTFSVDSNNCKMISVDLMFIEQTPGAQRTLKEAFVKKIIKEWNEYSIATLILSDRGDGTYAIVDGQHRWTAAVRLGYKDMLCIVHKNLTIAQESAMFTKCQERNAISAVEKFWSDVLQKDEDALMILNIVTDAGLKIGKSKNGGSSSRTIGSVKTLYYIRRRYGAVNLKHTLTLMAKCWTDDSGSKFSGRILAAVSNFFYRHVGEKNLNMVRMLRIFNSTSLTTIHRQIGEMKNFHSTPDEYIIGGIILTQLYNKGLGKAKCLHISKNWMH